jgi:hypothetical protein
MSERWQQEVRKLRDVEPTPGIWEDAMGRPPSGSSDDDHPPTRKRLIAGALALVVFIVAGAFAWQAFRPNDRLSFAEPSVSDVLRVRCDAQSLEVLTPVVAAQPDGIHVDADVTGLTDPVVGLKSKSDPNATHYSGSDGVGSVFVRQLPPGEATVFCESGPSQGDGPEDLSGSFTIVDPNGVFTDYRLSCADGELVGGGYLGPDGGALSPEEAITSQVEGSRSRDVIERAGYPKPAQRGPIYRLTRDGKIIGWFLLHKFPDQEGQDRYVVVNGYVCPGSGLHVFIQLGNGSGPGQ